MIVCPCCTMGARYLIIECASYHAGCVDQFCFEFTVSVLQCFNLLPQTFFQIVLITNALLQLLLQLRNTFRMQQQVTLLVIDLRVAWQQNANVCVNATLLHTNNVNCAFSIIFFCSSSKISASCATFVLAASFGGSCLPLPPNKPIRLLSSFFFDVWSRFVSSCCNWDTRDSNCLLRKPSESTSCSARLNEVPFCCSCSRSWASFACSSSTAFFKTCAWARSCVWAEVQ